MYTTNPDKQFVDIIASSLADDTGVKIQAGKAWACNVKDKLLIYNEDDLLKMPFYCIRGLMVHEIGHMNYTSKKNVASKYRKLYPEAMHNVYNCFEDRRMEYSIIDDDYRPDHFTRYARESLGLLNSYILEQNIKADIFKDMTKLEQFLHGSSIILANRQFSTVRQNKSIPTSIDGLHKIGISQDVIDRIKQLYSALEYLAYCDSSTELQHEINSNLIPHIEDYLKQQDKQDKKQQGKGKASKGKTGNDRKSMVETLSSGNKLSFTDSILDGIDFEYIGEAEAKLMLSTSINLLTRHLKSVLEARRTTKYTGSYNRGKLINKNIYKVGIKADRPFTKRVINSKPDKYHIHLFIDNSGSMTQLAGQTMLAGYLLQESLKNVDIPCTIVEFSTSTETKILDNISDYKVFDRNQVDYQIIG